MSDVLIKDLALPEDGAYDYHLTIRSDGKVEGWQQVGQRIVRINSWAVDVPPHGRIIDANVVLQWLNLKADNQEPVSIGEIFEFIDKQPTVLEANRTKRVEYDIDSFGIAGRRKS